jgi:SAM-dependent methyltransferase
VEPTPQNGLNTYPEVTAELGPGDSLGIGIAALLSGVEKYFAFDIVEYANLEKNLEIFNDLVSLFQNREKIPGEDEFPKVKPYLESYEFPSYILTDDRLERALKSDRLNRIKKSIAHPDWEESVIHYKVPWFDPNVLDRNSVDLIFSQAVLEHVDDLPNVYKAMQLWLKPDGLISHQIDFKSHGIAEKWNGHWTYSDFLWKLLKGKRPYLINREPHSAHIRLLGEEGFRLKCDNKIKAESLLSRNELARRFQYMTDEDLTTSGAFIQAIKGGEDRDRLEGVLGPNLN